jgi:hypothetical protein
MKDKNALLCLGIISLGVIFNAVGISSIKENLQDFNCCVKCIIVSINRRTQILRPHTHPDKTDDSNFGFSLAVSGNLLFVGAYQGDADNREGSTNNRRNQGFVEVFEITSSGIIKYTKGGNAFSENDGEQNVIRPHTNPYKLDNSNFGNSLAVSCNLLFVGAPEGDANNNESLPDVNDNNKGDNGFVEVFEITSSGIIKYTKGGNAFSKNDDGEENVIRPHTDPYKLDNSGFGSSLAVSCNLLFVGANRGDADNVQGNFSITNNYPNQGFVEVFEITSSGIIKYTKGDAFSETLGEENVIRPHTNPDKTDNSNFGNSLAVSCNLLFVGAPEGDADNVEGNFSNKDQGFIEVFEITPSGIVKYTKGGDAFSEKDGEENVIRPHTDPYKLDNSTFGSSLAVSCNLLFVGAPEGDADNVQGDLSGSTNNRRNQGFVEVFEITDGGIIKYTKGGNAFSKNDREQNVIRPHTNPYKRDDSFFGSSLAVSCNLLFVGAYQGDADNSDGSDLLTENRRNQGFVEVFDLIKE